MLSFYFEHRYEDSGELPGSLVLFVQVTTLEPGDSALYVLTLEEIRVQRKIEGLNSVDVYPLINARPGRTRNERFPYPDKRNRPRRLVHDAQAAK